MSMMDHHIIIRDCELWMDNQRQLDWNVIDTTLHFSFKDAPWPHKGLNILEIGC